MCLWLASVIQQATLVVFFIILYYVCRVGWHRPRLQDRVYILYQPWHRPSRLRIT